MNKLEYTNKIIKKYNAITEKEFKSLPYGKHFKYAKTSFLKDGVSCPLYVPPQRPSDHEELDLSQTIPAADLNGHERGDWAMAFQIGNNQKGGIY